MVKYLYLYFVSTCFIQDMVSDFPLLLHAWTDLKPIFLDIVCKKGLPLKTGQSMASSIFWWCLATRGGKVILGMVLWCSGLFLVALPCMMGIWGEYVASALLMFSVVIGKFLVRLFWTAYFRVFVDGHTTSCCSITTSSAPLIYRLREHDLLIFMVLRKVYYVVWFRKRPCWLCQKQMDLPHIFWRLYFCHCDGLRWCMGPIMYQ